MVYIAYISAVDMMKSIDLHAISMCCGVRKDRSRSTIIDMQKLSKCSLTFLTSRPVRLTGKGYHEIWTHL